MKHIIAAAMIGLFPFLCHADMPQAIHSDSTTGVKTWETHVDGVHFSLTQILPEQAIAFYVNRGFTLEQME